MASHFDDIGLRNVTQRELENMLLSREARVKPFHADGNTWARVRMGEKLYYWLGMEEDRDGYWIASLDFHFHSPRRNKAYFCRIVKKDRQGLNGMVSLQLCTSEGEIPLNVEVPVLAQAKRMQFGWSCGVQIAGYAEEAECWPDEETYNALGKKTAAEYMIPCGTFSTTDDPNFKESPHAMVGGRITGLETLTNSFTGQEYVHAAVESLGVEYDMLLAPEEVKGEMQVGGILHGTFWMSAMMYATSNTPDYTEMDDLPDEYEEETPEQKQDSAGCCLTVTRPVSDRILERIYGILSTLKDLTGEYITVEFTDCDDFVQAAAHETDGELLFLAEYSRCENGRRILRSKHSLTLQQVKEVFEQGCRLPSDEMDLTGWLDTGWRKPVEEEEEESEEDFEEYDEEYVDEDEEDGGDEENDSDEDDWEEDE